MTTQRAEGVAELLWELKRAGKLATYSQLADRAGFSAGSNGRAMQTCLKTVRKHWPHLQWWRAVADNGVVDSESDQVGFLEEAGFVLEEHDKGGVVLTELETVRMEWPEGPAD